MKRTSSISFGVSFGPAAVFELGSQMLLHGRRREIAQEVSDAFQAGPP
jgi:hypothetical protein